MTLYDEIQELKQFECEDRCVLSVYLNTNPADREAQNGAWKIQLKNGLKRLDEYLTASKDEKELKAYKELRKKVEKEITDNQGDLQKGVVIFASTQNDLFWVKHLQISVKTDFQWENKPALDQLRYIYKAYPYAGVVLPSFKGIRVLDTSVGIVNEEVYYEFDAGLEVWTEQKGVRSSGRIQGRSGAGSTGGGAAGGNSPVIGGSGGGSPTDELDHRLKENLDRFYKDMGSKIEKLKKERRWEEIHVIGEAEHAQSFSKVLHKKPNSCIHKNLINNSADKILHEVFEK
ncbi:VLRF1 family aeRF1-type release factor [Planococcus maritimus]|uniref:Antiporter n=1 Tax=Planococcus rifietoensis TaxID=200991 RepID=A0A0U2YX57_9BACL|nr:MULTISPECIES: VLRF1 family aeRF1-type release factor [Planococcus]ALS76126.1 antiporter [Planococcus rifietoensis]MDE4085604.1 VLRF1 family aeRF1-type release factor [Planococcus maritimus]